MATSSILGAERASSQPEGRDVEALGPSDSSDSGSDVQGELDLASPSDLDNTLFGTVQPGLESDSDSAGTGERGAALADEEAHAGSDIFPDHIENLTDEAELDLIEMADMDELAAEDREENEDDDPKEQIDDSPS